MDARDKQHCYSFTESQINELANVIETFSVTHHNDGFKLIIQTNDCRMLLHTSRGEPRYFKTFATLKKFFQQHFPDQTNITITVSHA